MNSLFNDALVAVLRRRLPRIEAYGRRPAALQEEQFRRLMAAGRPTVYGRQYGFRELRGIADFQRRVPVVAYETLFPYIERTMQGQQNVLWPSPIRFFSKSSGTTNARSKFIPVSREALDETHFKAGKDLMALWVQSQPGTRVFEGKGLSIGGSLAANQLSSRSVTGDISAVIMRNLPSWAQLIRTPSLEVALMDGWEQKLHRMARETARVNVTNLLGVPTWTLMLIQQVLQLTGRRHILEVWPNLEVFIHGAVAFQPYRSLFQDEIFGTDAVRFMETYNASEGFFGLQDDLSRPDEMLLMLDYGIFYEFVPAEDADNPFPKALTISEVEPGRNYALVITTNAGLWRYKIGDTIRFTSTSPYRFRISGRTKQFINAFGEELIVENAETALSRACQHTGARLRDYTAAPVYMGNGTRGGHEWVIEFMQEPASLEAFTTVLDETLRQINSDYDAKRTLDLALARPQVHGVPVGTFYAWMKQRGKVGGQHKVPRLSNSREYVDDILLLLERQAGR